MSKILDVRNRDLESENIIIYAGRISDAFTTDTDFVDYFKRAVSGSYPRNGMRFTVKEFCKLIEILTGKNSNELLKTTNCKYKGFQLLKVSDNTLDDWWLYYMPSNSLDEFSRINTKTNSAGIIGRILSYNKFMMIDSIYCGDYEFEIWFDLISDKILIYKHHKQIPYQYLDKDNSSIDLYMPSAYTDEWYTQVYTDNIFANLVGYSENTWNDFITKYQYGCITKLSAVDCIAQVILDLPPGSYYRKYTKDNPVQEEIGMKFMHMMTKRQKETML